MPMTTAIEQKVSRRLLTLDVYRGAVMFLMVSGGLGASTIGFYHPESRFWTVAQYELMHAGWVGCRLWDLLLPSFIFIAGVAIPFSYAARRARGQSTLRVSTHVVWRSLLLIGLGILLCSNGAKQTNYNFSNVLAQIGLCYACAYPFVGRSLKVKVIAMAVILVVYWYLFYQYPAPPADFDYPAFGSKPDYVPLTGLAAHWNLNTNFGWYFERWFLNLFPRSAPFEFAKGGYISLTFVAATVNMILGIATGELLRSDKEVRIKCWMLAKVGLVLLAIGVVCDPGIVPFVGRYWSLCPIVKRIWTPTWAIFSGGWSLLFLAGLYWLIEIKNIRAWSIVFTVMGMNSITAYLMNAMLGPWFTKTLQIHIGQTIFDGTHGPIFKFGSNLLIIWLLCWWMYRRRIFLKI